MWNLPREPAGEVVRAGIDCMLETFAIGMTRDKVITVVNPTQGRVEIRAGAVILAMGCRERSAGADDSRQASCRCDHGRDSPALSKP